ncbi:hypothetical protein PVAND_011901 [Polypedilum vanderplanki]|uniref:Odorant binding protein n=1 Tax=Polypedilum vanderplanki TaxID=319348 RepID=A0A9J6CKP9_POLVA|nr:hypothetical protein PVAND_011901 [Polypedilum vanderplanki]
MKYIVVFFLALCVLTLADEVEDAKKKHHDQINECIEETGISKESADKLKDGDFSERDEKAQCFTKCFFQKVGFLDSEGNPQADVIIEKLAHRAEAKEDETLKALVNRCIEVKGDNECETAFKIYECYRSGINYKKHEH